MKAPKAACCYLSMMPARFPGLIGLARYQFEQARFVDDTRPDTFRIARTFQWQRRHHF